MANLRVVSLIIKKAVAENTQPEVMPSKESVKSLDKYLSNAQTVNVVYEQLLQRATLDRDPKVVLRVLLLLKAYLLQHRPSAGTLKRLEEFCAQTHRDFGRQDPQMAKAVAQLRDIIGGGSGITDSAHSKVGGSRGAITSSTLKETTGTRLVADLLYVKPPPSIFPTRHRPVSLLGCALFGGHLRRAPAAYQADESKSVLGIDVNDALHVADAATHARHITSVGVKKKEVDTQQYKVQGQLTVRKKGYQGELFQYKSYAEQACLELDAAELDDVFNTVLSGTDQQRVLASKVLAKILMDLYCSKDTQASLQMLSFLLEMLESPQVETRVHAFNVVFNLSVHVHMYDTQTVEPDSLRCRSPAADAIQLDLFMKLKEMLLYIFQKDERDNRVWSVAFNCLTFFIAREGVIDKERLFSLDPRLFLVFLRHLQPDGDDVSRKLIRMLVNILYANKPGTLNVDLLHHVGGIQDFVHHYITTRSSEAKHNIFRVLFDYVVTQLALRKQVVPEAEQVAIIFELLKRFDLPSLLPQVFKYPPEKFVETLVRYMFFDQLKKDQLFADISAKLDKTLIVAFLYDIEKLALSHWALQPEFDAKLRRNLQQHELTEKDKVILRALLTSGVDSDRRNGESWLFALMRACAKGTCRVPLADITAIFSELAQSPVVESRRVFLGIAEKLFLMDLSKLPAAQYDDAKLGQAFERLNRNLMLLVNQGEKNIQNLMCMWDIVYNATTMRPLVPPENPYVESPHDANYQLLVKGYSYVPPYLLQKIDVRVLLHLFKHVNNRNFSDTRVAVLLLLIHQCQSDRTALEQCGGNPFFTKLIEDKNPKLSYHAARYILSQIQREQPQLYREHMTKLIAEARRTNNEQLLQNPYLQVKSILASTAAPS